MLTWPSDAEGRPMQYLLNAEGEAQEIKRLSPQEAARALHHSFCGTEDYVGMVLDFRDWGESQHGPHSGWLLLIACWQGTEPTRVRDLEWFWRHRPDVGQRFCELTYLSHYSLEKLRRLGAMQQAGRLQRITLLPSGEAELE